ncbi:MAG TPA: IPT/TIG domain-containing protein [Elusimicrobiota bacterium]|nr:IPT/TIG domain-containing protein [Elusimicrobiota bacterium]
MPCAEASAQVPHSPSIVKVAGHQLIVQKRLADGSLDAARPYIMKGVNWQPATVAPATGPDPLDASQSVPYGCFYDYAGRNPEGHVVFNYWLQSQFPVYYSSDIPIIQQLNANTVRIFEPFSTDSGAMNLILDELYNAGVMVIMTVGSSADDFNSGAYLTAVQQAMNHPAILMWALGNEWNLNNLYGTYPNISSATSAIQSAALAVKNVDSNHPVSSSLGDIFTVDTTNPCLAGIPQGTPNTDIPTIVAAVTAVDIWGLNVYRGMSFGSLFQQWTAATAKPFFLGEFGIDSFNTTSYNLPLSTPTSCGPSNIEAYATSGAEDQTTQSAWDLDLWNEVAAHLSGLDSQNQCVGGNVFSFNDMLWQVGNYNVGLGGLPDPTGNCTNTTPNTGGFLLPGSSQDPVTNEEYFGIVSSIRSPKVAYTTLTNAFQAVAPPQVPAISYIDPPSAPAGGPMLTLTIHGSDFSSDAYVLWNGSPRTATYVNSTELRVALSAIDIAQAGNQDLFVINPSTTGAASPLTTFSVESPTSANAVRVSPNPWRSDRHAGVAITFDQLPANSTIKIFTLSGRSVRTLTAMGGFADWDRTNDDGKTVASGIYLFVASDPQGNKTQGRLAILK